MDKQFAAKLAAAREEVRAADEVLTALVGQIKVAPRAEKMAVSKIVDEALARLRLAASNLAEIQNLVDETEQ